MVLRLIRDHSNALKIFTYRVDRKSFDSSNVLMNISTGEVCNGTVYVHIVNDIGEGLIRSMKGLSFFYFSFKKKGKVETMSKTSSVVIDNEIVGYMK